MIRLIRSDDVYLHDIANGVPWWGPRDEARRFLTRKLAHAYARKVRAYPGTFAEVVVVRLVKKGSR